jgi:hypothetical protein
MRRKELRDEGFFVKGHSTPAFCTVSVFSCARLIVPTQLVISQKLLFGVHVICGSSRLCQTRLVMLCGLVVLFRLCGVEWQAATADLSFCKAAQRADYNRCSVRS